MKILLLNLYPMNNSSGGMEKVFITLSKNLTELGHNITAAYFDRKPGKPFFVTDKNNIYTVNLYQKPNIWNSPKFIKYRSFFIFHQNERKEFRNSPYPQKRQIIQSFIKKENPDLVILFQPEGYYCLPPQTKRTFKTILTLHGSSKHYFQTDQFNLIEKSFNAVDQIITLLNSFNTPLIQYTQSTTPILSIPNIVPPIPKISINKRNIITYVARISPEKRHELLISAFALIANKFPLWSIELWGDTNCSTEYTNKLKLLIQKLQLENRIVFKGTSNKVTVRIQSSRFTVFPSESEGFGLALAEALSVGLPAIGFKNAPGVNELIQDQYNGYLVEDSIEALANAMRRLMQSSELCEKLGKNAIESVQKYSKDNVMNQWQDLLQSLEKNS